MTSSSDQLVSLVAGGSRLEAALRQLGVAAGTARDSLVYDASELEPASWDELEDELAGVARLCKEAGETGAPVVFVLHEPGLYGHASVLRSALACGLLGGARALASEWQRSGPTANVVTMSSSDEVPQAAVAVRFLLSADRIRGQVVSCGPEHVGRPAA